jgi:hypothetical protein
MHRTLVIAFVGIALLGAGVALAATPKITGSGVGAVKLHKR